MAQGTVVTIDNSGVTGKISVSGTEMDFVEPGMASKNILVNDTVTFVEVTNASGKKIAINLEKN